jgi:protein Mpv17
MAALTLARAYQHSFDTHPNSTLALTGACLTAFGDVVAQVAQVTAGRRNGEERHTYDVARTTRFFCYGLAISPVMGRWNAFLERRFPLRRSTGKISFKALSKRVAADQLIMAPIGLGLFLSSMGIMEARSPRQIRERFSALYQTALVANWKVWPMAQLVNFRYMPLPYRVPFSQTCGVFWTLYLSILNSEETKQQDKEVALRKTLDAQ